MLSFLSFSFSFFRRLAAGLRGFSSCVWFFVWLPLLPWLLPSLLLRRLFFVRFPRPRRWPSRSCGRPSFSSGFRGRWACVPVASLPAARLVWFVWAVRPALVARRSGELLWVWVFVSSPPLRGEAAEAAAKAAAKRGTAREVI